MTATLNDVTGRKKRPELSAEAKAAAELVRAAKEHGLSLTGPDGLLKQLTKTSRSRARPPPTLPSTEASPANPD